MADSDRTARVTAKARKSIMKHVQYKIGRASCRERV